jgi:DNA polymerase-3 subunit delta'
VGQGAALARAARAIRAGRPPQAWLITGPPGIGKATLAYRIARYLLRYGATDQGPKICRCRNDPVSLQVKAGAHPGLLVLKRGLQSETGKLDDGVAGGRNPRLANFFGLTSGAGGWRVAIVDTADDMNDNAANALLKLLEEPPSRAMLMLLWRTRRTVAPDHPLALPAARSASARRRRNWKRSCGNFCPNRRRTSASAGEACRRFDRARRSGSQASDGLMLAEQAERLIERADSPDFAAALSLAEKVAKIDDGIDIFGGFLAQALADRIRRACGEGGVRLDRWVRCCGKAQYEFRADIGVASGAAPDDPVDGARCRRHPRRGAL